MKSAVLFGFCLVVALVVESFGEENDYRMRKCKKKCKVGECCRIVWYWYECFQQRGLGQPCRKKPPAYLCHHGCRDGLVCKRVGRPTPAGERHPHHRRRFKCVRPPPPTEEPGSGDLYM
ncbi:uncharacterized protein [Pocillopora verrucosa]|uniref:uncharacterized protein n=1 Tax=Pocillopora verrucosa TaxID=203993 RepID=UPI00279743F7|nr:uncharacterized protein LOC131798634 [Pocillopora verrucosa]